MSADNAWYLEVFASFSAPFIMALHIFMQLVASMSWEEGPFRVPKVDRFWFFVRWQRLISRNVRELFSSNHGISHFYAARRIDELRKGSISGPGSWLVLVSVYRKLASKKLCIGSVFVFHLKSSIMQPPGRYGAGTRDSRWLHPVALGEALDGFPLGNAPCVQWFACIFCRRWFRCRWQPKVKTRLWSILN